MNIKVYDARGNPLRALFQWDCNQTIRVSGVDPEEVPNPYFHFCNAGSSTAYVVQADTDSSGDLTAGIPNVVLQQAKQMIVYICDLSASETETVGEYHTYHKIKIDVIPRAKPENYSPEDDTVLIVGVSSATIDENGHLVFTYSDGSTDDVGEVKIDYGRKIHTIDISQYSTMYFNLFSRLLIEAKASSTKTYGYYLNQGVDFTEFTDAVKNLKGTDTDIRVKAFEDDNFPAVPVRQAEYNTGSFFFDMYYDNDLDAAYKVECQIFPHAIYIFATYFPCSPMPL